MEDGQCVVVSESEMDSEHTEEATEGDMSSEAEIGSHGSERSRSTLGSNRILIRFNKISQ